MKVLLLMTALLLKKQEANYIDYVIYNYNHNAVPKETLEKVLVCYQFSIEDISDKLISPSDDDDDDLIGGLEDLPSKDF